MQFNGNHWAKYLPTKVVVNLATLGPVGFMKPGPGTWGSLAGLLFYALCLHWLSPMVFFIALVAMFYASLIICGEAEVRMHKHDPSEVVLDEFVAIPMCFVGLGSHMEGGMFTVLLVVGFVLFRFFDILKPLGIKKLQDLPGGLGVVVDDFVAAIYTCVCLQIIVRLI